MSIKNRITDRDANGRIARKYTGPARDDYPWSTPGWWVSLYMTRPRRRKTRILCRALVRDEIDADDVIFPLGNHKPHEY